jgi:shikimate dehydrogenase
LRQISTSTRLLAVFGDPVEHSLSPAMHNAAISDLGLDFVYLAFRVRESELAAALRGVRAMGIAGVNLTIPLKQAALALVDELADSAAEAGAVNTVVNKSGRFVGHNTDSEGFIASMQEDLGLTPSGLRVCILGAGGSARGVSVAVARHGAASVVFAARNLERAEALAGLVSKLRPECSASAVSLGDRSKLRGVLESSDLLVNSTPVGMSTNTDDPIEIEFERLPSGACVADLIYNPLKTVFLRQAEMRGYRTMNGVGMLAHQGALAFELWTGVKPDVQAMRQSLHDCLTQGGYL